MDENGNDVIRITHSSYHHRIVGIDRTKRYILATRVVEDTDPPEGLGDEDRKSLWLLDLETGHEKRLTDPANNAEGDSFSPDGEWIVFQMVVAGDRQADIYKMRIDGSSLTRLTHTNDATESDPSWSSDGKNIAFVSYSAHTGRFVLMVMDADGQNVRTVYDPADTVSTPYFKPGVYDPSWSPDDQWIVFEKPVRYGGENGDAGVWHIFKIHPDGSGLTDLSEKGGHTDMAEYLPSFSADGERIVFSARHGPSDPAKVQIDIFTMNKDGGSIKRLTSTEAIEDFGVWIK
ncbi:MAG: PD40 domain-containing protein [Thermoplasmata archaeon]|nr:PD40 domain-containing protein [Thermoplasmata archaeon]